MFVGSSAIWYEMFILREKYIPYADLYGTFILRKNTAQEAEVRSHVIFFSSLLFPHLILSQICRGKLEGFHGNSSMVIPALVLSLFQNTCHSSFSRYNPLICCALDIYNVHMHNKENVCRKVRIISILKQRKYIGWCLKILPC
jgi:hypothetical protein